MKMTIDIKTPTSWQQLSLEQLYIVAELLDANLDRHTLLLVLFCKLAGLKTTWDKGEMFFVAGKTRFRLEPYQFRQFCDKMAFIIDEKPICVVNPTKVNDYLIDVRFGDYFQADALVERYSKTGDVKFIKRALKRLGDNRLFVSKVKANAIMLWWCGVRGFLKEKYPLVFPDSAGDMTQKSSYEMLQDVLLMLNENRPQDNKLIEESDVHGVLSALNSKIDMYNKQKELFKK